MTRPQPMGAMITERSNAIRKVFDSEQDLVKHFLNFLNAKSTPWGKLIVKTEFSYQRGRADIVAVTVDGHILAFEAKLCRWREAVHQSYRNTCFAHEAYVVLPEEATWYARKHDREFERRGVGLCTVSDGAIDVVKQARLGKPLQKWLSQNAYRMLMG